MNLILAIILLILMLYIDKNRGIKLFLGLIFNFIILIILFYLMALGLNPIICALIGCLLISYVILYFVNGENIKTKTAIKSVIVVILILSVLIFIMTNISRIAGFGEEAYEEINMFSYDVNIDFTNITIALILIGLIGVTVDAAIAISSALYEVYINNKSLSKRELFKSGMNIGKDILCTSMNTLLFAFLSEFMTLVIWYYECNYSFIDIINSKTFASEIIKIMFSAIGCISVIPITAYITSNTLIKNKKQTEEIA